MTPLLIYGRLLVQRFVRLVPMGAGFVYDNVNKVTLLWGGTYLRDLKVLIIGGAGVQFKLNKKNIYACKYEYKTTLVKILHYIIELNFLLYLLLIEESIQTGFSHPISTYIRLIPDKRS